jgi:hypothetical protein
VQAPGERDKEIFSALKGRQFAGARTPDITLRARKPIVRIGGALPENLPPAEPKMKLQGPPAQRLAGEKHGTPPGRKYVEKHALEARNLDV